MRSTGPPISRSTSPSRDTKGGYLLSAVLQEGGCSLSMQGSEVPTSGEWIPLAGASEILTLVPTLAGPLRISFEVKAEGGEQSGRSFVHFTVTESPEART